MARRALFLPAAEGRGHRRLRRRTRAVRDPADILPTGAGERSSRRPGPRAVNRELHASVVDSTIPMATRMFDRAAKRDPHHRRRWIVLVDGNNHQIERIHAEAHADGVRVEVIVDFVHVLEYLWKAAEDLHSAQPGRAGSSPAPPGTSSRAARPGSCST